MTATSKYSTTFIFEAHNLTGEFDQIDRLVSILRPARARPRRAGGGQARPCLASRTTPPYRGSGWVLARSVLANQGLPRLTQQGWAELI